MPLGLNSAEIVKLKQYYIDAFATRLFEGNPAAVCQLEAWLDDRLLQAISAENNLPGTAFCVPSENGYEMRWFTPTKEIELCGHATLAAAHVIFNILGYPNPVITFTTRRGNILVAKRGKRLEMSLPSCPPKHCEIPELLIRGLGYRPIEVLAAIDYLAIFENDSTVSAIEPNHTLLSQLDLRGVIVSAPSAEVDFVSRFFAPKLGVLEDPVCGSSHCELAPYWAGRLSKYSLRAKQISARGGNILCSVMNDRVFISGHAITYMAAEIVVDCKRLS